MEFQQKLSGLKAVIDKEIEHQFDLAIESARKKDHLIAEALEHTKKIALSGGKRIRAALMQCAYFGVGGKEKKKILKAAVSIEFVHLFLLVHDDIIDRGDLRHGKETLHRLFSRKYKGNSIANSEHFGDSMAVIVGDMLYAISQKIILKVGFPFENLVPALFKLQDVVSTTIAGQSQDIAIENSASASFEEVLKMYENKTARYTFEGPLHMGAILAGCNDKKTFDLLSRYSLPLGIAFQVQDDILGVFGSRKKIGKSVASDIEEGKISLLVVMARQSASADQKKKLNSILGKKNLSNKEIKDFQNILRVTGALEYCQNFASELIKEAKTEIEKVIVKKDSKDFLIGLAEYLEKREI